MAFTGFPRLYPEPSKDFFIGATTRDEEALVAAAEAKLDEQRAIQLRTDAQMKVLGKLAHGPQEGAVANVESASDSPDASAISNDSDSVLSF
eukprot:m.137337 g.137337  ORF g.137337 m.137337 type:complete len:92 (+) comp14897_c0_seq4:2334-2609(+)